MKLSNLKIAATASFLLLGIALSGQNKKDSLINIPIQDLETYEECCIREYQLEQDTLRLSKDNSDYKQTILTLQQENKNDIKIQRDLTSQNILTTSQMVKYQDAYNSQLKLKVTYRRMIIIFCPVAFALGIYVGTHLK